MSGFIGEAASRKLATDAEELRNDADKTEENARSLKAAAEEKKKGRFGGKKYKKLHDSAEQANKDAADIKKRFMAVQTEAYEAATLAATTRSVADRLHAYGIAKGEVHLCVSYVSS
eukprot:CAMPEP_0170808120 /NCGR_PEP_ID=MMETSP0733-20121128/33204_1 /TAXON_ID=186038 /ORGANISM="Fragilariopsis kerguelensis, Strain L26-C5" /LENGTH=115 /DNA_ID=CAMNT_0011163487 /DNA_START=656 /DNA_END=1004 /DNA_ORIENTATION=+